MKKYEYAIEVLLSQYKYAQEKVRECELLRLYELESDANLALLRDKFRAMANDYAAAIALLSTQEEQK